MFLKEPDLQKLTGYKRPSAMRRWLARNGYRFDVARDGYPQVLVSQVEKRQGVRKG